MRTLACAGPAGPPDPIAPLIDARWLGAHKGGGRMKVTILDDYLDTLRTLGRFTKLAALKLPARPSEGGSPRRWCARRSTGYRWRVRLGMTTGSTCVGCLQ
jgi:hypothetical protein